MNNCSSYVWKNRVAISITPICTSSRLNFESRISSCWVFAVVSIPLNESFDSEENLSSSLVQLELAQIYDGSLIVIGSCLLSLGEEKSIKDLKSSCSCCWQSMGQYFAISIVNRLLLFSIVWYLADNSRQVTLFSAVATNISSCIGRGSDDTYLDPKDREWCPIRVSITLEGQIRGVFAIQVHRLLHEVAIISIITQSSLIMTDWTSLLKSLSPSNSSIVHIFSEINADDGIDEAQFEQDLWLITLQKKQPFHFTRPRHCPSTGNVHRMEGQTFPLSGVDSIRMIEGTEGGLLFFSVLGDGSLAVCKEQKYKQTPYQEQQQEEGKRETKTEGPSLLVGIQFHPVFLVHYREDDELSPSIQNDFTEQRREDAIFFEEISRVFCIELLSSHLDGETIRTVAVLLVSTCHLPAEVVNAFKKGDDRNRGDAGAMQKGGQINESSDEHFVNSGNNVEITRPETLSLMEVTFTEGLMGDGLTLTCTQIAAVVRRIWKPRKTGGLSDERLELVHTAASDSPTSACLIILYLDGTVTGVAQSNMSERLFFFDVFSQSPSGPPSRPLAAGPIRYLVGAAARGCLLLAHSTLGPSVTSSTVSMLPMLLPLENCDQAGRAWSKQRQNYWIDLTCMAILSELALGESASVPLPAEVVRRSKCRTLKLPSQLLLQLSRHFVQPPQLAVTSTKAGKTMHFKLSSSMFSLPGRARSIRGERKPVEHIALIDDRCFSESALHPNFQENGAKAREKTKEQLPMGCMVLWIFNSATGRWKGVDLSLIHPKAYSIDQNSMATEALPFLHGKRLFENDEKHDQVTEGAHEEQIPSGKIGTDSDGVKNGGSFVVDQDRESAAPAHLNGSPRAVQEVRTLHRMGSPRAADSDPNLRQLPNAKPTKSNPVAIAPPLGSFHCLSVRWLGQAALLLITSRGGRHYVELVNRDCLPVSSFHVELQQQQQPRAALRRSCLHKLYQLPLLQGQPRLLDLITATDRDHDESNYTMKQICLLTDDCNFLVMQIETLFEDQQVLEDDPLSSQANFSALPRIRRFSVHQLCFVVVPSTYRNDAAADTGGSTPFRSANLWFAANEKNVRLSLIDSYGYVQLFSIDESSRLDLLAVLPSTLGLTSSEGIDISSLTVLSLLELSPSKRSLPQRSHSQDSDVQGCHGVCLLDELFLCGGREKEPFFLVQFKNRHGKHAYLKLPTSAGDIAATVHPPQLSSTAGRDRRFEYSPFKPAVAPVATLFGLFQSIVSFLCYGVTATKDELRVALILFKTLFAEHEAEKDDVSPSCRHSDMVELAFANLVLSVESHLLEMSSRPVIVFPLERERDRQREDYFRTICGLLWTFNQTLLGEILSRLCRKFEPALSKSLLPVSVPSVAIAGGRLSVVRLFELSLGGGQLLQAARFLSPACECVGGSSSHVTAVACFVLALELFLQCALGMSLKLSRDTLEFCLRIERAIELHSQMIFGAYSPRVSNGCDSNVRNGEDHKGRDDKRLHTLDGSYIRTVKSKALKLIAKSRLESPVRVGGLRGEEVLLDWLAIHRRKKERTTRAAAADQLRHEARSKVVYDDGYFPGKGIISAVTDIIDWAAQPRHAVGDAKQSSKGAFVEVSIAAKRSSFSESSSHREEAAFEYNGIALLQASCGEELLTRLLSCSSSSGLEEGGLSIAQPTSLTLFAIAALVRSLLDTGSHFYTVTVLVASLLRSDSFVTALKHFLRDSIASRSSSGAEAESGTEMGEKVQVDRALLVFRLSRPAAHLNEEEMQQRLDKSLDAQYLRRAVEAEMVYRHTFSAAMHRHTDIINSSNHLTVGHAVVSESSSDEAAPSSASVSAAGSSSQDAVDLNGSFNHSTHCHGPSGHGNNNGMRPKPHLGGGSSYFELSEDFFDGDENCADDSGKESTADRGGGSGGRVRQLVRSLCLCYLIAHEPQSLRRLLRKLGPLCALLVQRKSVCCPTGNLRRSALTDGEQNQLQDSESDVAAFVELSRQESSGPMDRGTLEAVLRLLLPIKKKE